MHPTRFAALSTALLSLFLSGCHEHCGPDGAAPLEAHQGSIVVAGSVDASVDGAALHMPQAHAIEHCLPADPEPYCFRLDLPLEATAPGTYDLAEEAGLPYLLFGNGGLEPGDVEGTITVTTYDVQRESGGEGEGDGDVVNVTLRARVDALLTFAESTVTLDLELDRRGQEALTCYSHLLP